MTSGTLSGLSESRNLCSSCAKVSVWLRLTLAARVPCRGRPSPAAPASSQAGPCHFLTSPVFHGQCVLSQADFWVFQTKVCIRGVQPLMMPGRASSQEIGSPRASEHAASRASTLGLSSPLPWSPSRTWRLGGNHLPHFEKEKARL